MKWKIEENIWRVEKKAAEIFGEPLSLKAQKQLLGILHFISLPTPTLNQIKGTDYYWCGTGKVRFLREGEEEGPIPAEVFVNIADDGSKYYRDIDGREIDLFCDLFVKVNYHLTPPVDYNYFIIRWKGESTLHIFYEIIDGNMGTMKRGTIL